MEKLNNNKTILVVIPVYNHLGTVRAVVEEVLKYSSDVLVVDDGCSESVADVLNDCAVEVVRHPENRGKGQAILSAAAYARDNGYDYIITLDADGQHFPSDIPLMRTAIENHFGSVIIGVRDFSSSDIPASSKFGRKFGNFWVRIQTGVKVGDIQSGYRAYPVFLLNSMHCMFKTFAFEDEIVVRSLWSGLPLEEVPVSVYYSPTDRISNFNKFRDNIKLTILNTYLTIRSCLPWPHMQIQCYEGSFSQTSKPLKVVTELLAQKKTPMQLAMAAGLGVFLGSVPLIGIHTLAIIYVASMFRLSKVMAVAVSHICMPPFVPALCIEIGYFIRNGKWLTMENFDAVKQASFYDLGNMGFHRFLEWLIGSLIVGPVLAILLIVIVYVFIRHVQKAVLWKK